MPLDNTKKIKILLVIPTYLPLLGGAELAVHNIAKSLNKFEDIEADVLTFNITTERWNVKLKNEYTTIDGVNVFRIGGINVLFFLKNRFRSMFIRFFGVQIVPFLSFYRVVKKYDVIHFNDEVNLSMPFFLLFTKAKKLFHLRTLIQLKFSFSKHPIAKKLLQNISPRYIVETNKYDTILDEFDIPMHKRIYWKKGVDTDLFRRINFSNNKLFFSVLSIGRISDKQKGFHLIIDAIFKCKFSIDFTLITPKFSPNKYTKALFSKIEQVNRTSNHNITVVVDVPQKDTVKFYNMADLFVFTPVEDSMPNVLLEASSCECPIIASKTGGIPNIIVDSISGILVPINCVQSIVDQMQFIKNNPKAASVMGKRARMHVVENYSMNKAASSLVKIYDSL